MVETCYSEQLQLNVLLKSIDNAFYGFC